MQGYVVTILMDAHGDMGVFVGNNHTLANFMLEAEDMPPFLIQRIALVKLMERNPGMPEHEGEVGRRINDQMLHVYLSRSEFLKLKHIKRSAK